MKFNQSLEVWRLLDSDICPNDKFIFFISVLKKPRIVFIATFWIDTLRLIICAQERYNLMFRRTCCH